ncbi:MAG: hypothetical protein K2V38_16190 [Gemmataceae bacterium]|nr:hypothetical protein [Gemmataceae bacterium]
MPIRFRCSYCNKLLGIATRKAGTETLCPHCGYTIVVPMPLDDAQTERVPVDDVAELLGSSATEKLTRSGLQAAAAPPAAPRPQPPAPPEPAPSPKARPKPPPEAKPAPASKQSPAPLPPSPSPEVKPALRSDSQPLFEGDVDDILGTPSPTEEPARPKPPPTSGADAMSLAEPPNVVVLSATTATVLLGVVTVLLVLAFLAGYFVAK